MINIATLRRLLKDSLKADAFFTSSVNTLLGGDLNYFLGTNEDRSDEDLPAIVFLTDAAQDPEGEKREYSILFHIQISGSQNPDLVGGDKEYTSEELVGDIAILAEKTLRRKTPCIEVSGQRDFFISDTNMAIAPITDSMSDEDDDLDDDGEIGVTIGYMATVEIIVSHEKFLNN